jgi:hypothetical protein
MPMSSNAQPRNRTPSPDSGAAGGFLRGHWPVLLGAAGGMLLGMLVTLQFTPQPQPAPAQATSTTGTARDGARTGGAAITLSGLGARDTSVGPGGGNARGALLSAVADLELRSEMGQLVARLRESGVSEDLLSIMVAADFDRRWRDFSNEINRKFRMGEIDDSERQLFFLQRDTAREMAIRAALGDEAFVRWDRDRVLRSYEVADIWLNEKEKDELYRFQKQSDLTRQELTLANQRGEIDPVDYQEQLRQNREAYDRQLEEMLGSYRFAEYRQGTDWSLGRLRRELRDLGLAETHLEAVHQANQAYNQAQARLRDLQRSGELKPEDYNRQLREARAERDQAIGAALGESAHAEYQKLQDTRYKQMRQYATAWQLAPRDIEHVYRSITEAQQAVNQFRREAQAGATREKPVNWKEVNDAINQYQAEAAEELRRYLGEDRYNKLRRAGVIPFGS